LKISLHDTVVNSKFPIGVLSDVHGNIKNVKLVIDQHPEITQWFCLGDIVDDKDRFGGNQETVDWWKTCNIITVLGNHDMYYAAKKSTDSNTLLWFKQIPRSLKVQIGNDIDFLCYHSLPNDPITFIEPYYTEREFIDDYPIDDKTLAVLIGHNHKQFKSVFHGCSTELWSVGSIGISGSYAIIDNNGIQFKKLVTGV